MFVTSHDEMLFNQFFICGLKVHAFSDRGSFFLCHFPVKIPVLFFLVFFFNQLPFCRLPRPTYLIVFAGGTLPLSFVQITRTPRPGLVRCSTFRCVVFPLTPRLLSE